MNIRIKSLQKYLQKPILISKKENLLYLTGCNIIHGNLLVTKKIAVFFGDGLEAVPGVKFDYLKNISKYVRSGSELAVEDDMRLGVFSYLRKVAPKIKYKSVGDALTHERIKKTPDELAHIRSAVVLTHEVFKTVKKALKAESWTEAQLARFIRYEGIAAGAEDVSFDPIVAAGSNAAIPHHKPTTKVIKHGEPVILDFGFKVNGYCSDFTRTVFIKRAAPEWRQRYEHTLNAYKAAFTGVQAGMEGRAVDKLARDVLEKEKLSKFFVHSLGHGTGLEIHEAPGVGPYATDILEDSMVFSIEPGVYIKGKGGIRIEDLVYLKAGKPVQFNECSRELKDSIL